MSSELEQEAARIAAAEMDAAARKKAKSIEDPGARFTFVKGRPLPSGFQNPKCGTKWHRCVDDRGLYQPDWKQFRVFRTDNTQSEVIYVHAAAVSRRRVRVACHNRVRTNMWMDAPTAVIETIRQTRRETVDMVSTDAAGNPLGLTGPQRIFRVVEDRPQYNCEVMDSA